MRCPHCQTVIKVGFQVNHTGYVADGEHYATSAFQCPSCSGITIDLHIGNQLKVRGNTNSIDDIMLGSSGPVRLFPRNSNRPNPPMEVPARYAVDYIEAALTLADSPKASAALSRRCLQHLLQNELKIVKANLFQEIEEAIKGRNLPSHVADGLDAVRQIGNFAAHPKKSTASGEIIEVEEGEAEWSLDVLDGLFDHLFVGPAKMTARRAALDAKIQAAKGP